MLLRECLGLKKSQKHVQHKIEGFCDQSLLNNVVHHIIILLLTTVSWYQNVRRTNPVRRENLKASVTTQVIICLLGVQENSEEDRLPHGRKLLEHLGFEGGSPCQNIVERDG